MTLFVNGDDPYSHLPKSYQPGRQNRPMQVNILL